MQMPNDVFPSTTTIATFPDVNTGEAIMYGSKYLFAKSVKFYWDSVESELRHQEADLKKQIRDPEFASYVLSHRPNMIFSREAPTNDLEQIRDLRVLKEIIKVGTSIKKVQLLREKNLMYARMHGIAEYSDNVLKDGITEETWKAATAEDNRPIDFDTIRALIDDDKMKAKIEAEQFILDEEELQKERDAFEREYADYVNSQFIDSVSEREIRRENEPELNFTIFKEVDLSELEVENNPDVTPYDAEYWREYDETYEEEDTGSESVSYSPAMSIILDIAESWTKAFEPFIWGEA